ncbi:hypothetical protein ACFU5O_37080 [Streptomyces sp. NPDC057445]|uniref:hypothetical protein n=1 Tax=Streptomyces sp. NPDC057445 TaxID=3346136 RepID=UPI00369ACF34
MLQGSNDKQRMLMMLWWFADRIELAQHARQIHQTREAGGSIDEETDASLVRCFAEMTAAFERHGPAAADFTRGRTLRELWQAYVLLYRAPAILVTTSEEASAEGFVVATSLPGLTLLRWLSRAPEHGPRLLGIWVGERGLMVMHGGVTSDGRVMLRDPLDCSDVIGRAFTAAGIACEQYPEHGLVIVDHRELAPALHGAVIPSSELPEYEYKPIGARLGPISYGQLSPDIYDPQILRFETLTGAPPECAWYAQYEMVHISHALVNRDLLANDPVQRVPYRTRVSGESLITLLFASLSVSPGIPLFVDTGEGGHCVTAIQAVRGSSSVVFLDSWPGRSLLAEENNRVDVAANPVHGGRWSVTGAELHRCLQLIFVPSVVWSIIRGQEYYRTVDELLQELIERRRPLWEVVRRERGEPFVRSFVPIMNPGRASVHLTCAPDDGILEMLVEIDATWLNSEDGISLFCDLLQYAIPRPDFREAKQVIEALRKLPAGLEPMMQLIRSGPVHLTDQWQSLVNTLHGSQTYGRLVLPLSRIEVDVLTTRGKKFARAIELRVTRADYVREPLLFKDLRNGYQMTEERRLLVEKVANDRLFADWANSSE